MKRSGASKTLRVADEGGLIGSGGILGRENLGEKKWARRSRRDRVAAEKNFREGDQTRGSIFDEPRRKKAEPYRDGFPSSTAEAPRTGLKERTLVGEKNLAGRGKTSKIQKNLKKHNN